MSTRSKLLVLIVALCATPLLAYADISVAVPDHCTVTDTGGGAHTYTGQYFAICALQAALDAGSVSNAQFSNAFPSLGLFVTTLNGAAANPASEYWALYQNGGFASLGLSQLPVAAGDTVTLELHDFSDNFLGQRLTMNISSLVAAPVIPPAPIGNSITLHDPFDIPRALAYLAEKQRADGSFGSPLLDDWVAIASAGGGAGDLRSRLAAYEKKSAPALSSATDYERHAMALEALGINPYDGAGTDYIGPIVSRFDGIQVGDTLLINDDIFALFPLLHAGYSTGDDIIATIARHVIEAQKNNGSWEESVDLTAAGVQTLLPLRQLPGATEAVSKALSYLHAKQSPDGGFDNSFSTSWVLQAIAASDGTTEDWNKSSYRTPQYYLATLQARDGGLEESVEDDMRVWATAYAVPAVARRPWHDLLQTFPKPSPIAVPAPTSTVEIVTAAKSGTTSEAVPPTASETPPVPPPTTPVQTNQPQEETVIESPEVAQELAPIPAQVASAAESAPRGLIGTFWRSILSFFAGLF